MSPHITNQFLVIHSFTNVECLGKHYKAEQTVPGNFDRTGKIRERPPGKYRFPFCNFLGKASVYLLEAELLCASHFVSMRVKSEINYVKNIAPGSKNL